MRVLGIIPARGGSKGIPRKNLEKINKVKITQTCPICYDELKPVCTTVCGHSMCTECFVNGLLRSNKCALCRKQITDISVIPRKDHEAVLAENEDLRGQIDALTSIGPFFRVFSGSSNQEFTETNAIEITAEDGGSLHREISELFDQALNDQSNRNVIVEESEPHPLHSQNQYRVRRRYCTLCGQPGHNRNNRSFHPL